MLREPAAAAATVRRPRELVAAPLLREEEDQSRPSRAAGEPARSPNPRSRTAAASLLRGQDARK